MIAFILGFFTNAIGVIAISFIPVFILIAIKESIKSFLWKKGYRVYNKEELRKMNGIKNIDKGVVELNQTMYTHNKKDAIEATYRKTGG